MRQFHAAVTVLRGDSTGDGGIVKTAGHTRHTQSTFLDNIAIERGKMLPSEAIMRVGGRPIGLKNTLPCRFIHVALTPRPASWQDISVSSSGPQTKGRHEEFAVG